MKSGAFQSLAYGLMAGIDRGIKTNCSSADGVTVVALRRNMRIRPIGNHE